MRRSLFALSAIALLSLTSAIAQPPPPPPPPPAAQLTDWVPRGLEAISQHAAFHTDFTFDRSMLHFGEGFFDNGDEDVRRAIGRLNGISVHSYRFASPGAYDPNALENVRQQYHGGAWKHIVTAEDHRDRGIPGADAPPPSGRTDVWVGFEHGDVTGVVVMLAGIRNVEVIVISGDLSVLDLLHLRGHFGIPRFPEDSLEHAPLQH